MTDQSITASMAAAAATVEPVRAVEAVVLGATPDERALVAIRVALPGQLTLQEAGRALARVRGAVSAIAPAARVFVEPVVETAPAVPTEAIVIRASE